MISNSRRRTGEGGRHGKTVKVAAYLTSLVTVASFGAALATGPAGAATPSAISTSALRYTPLSSPMRVADTRAGATDPATYAGKTLSAGTSLTVDIPKTVVPATAGAAVVNITATNPSGQGFLSVYPGGKTYATTSNVNFTKGQTVANLVTVGLGATQSFTVYDGPTTATGGGTVDFTADVEGYYSATGKSAYVATAPHRVYDSRANSGLPGAGMTLGAGKTDNVSVIATKTDGVPSTATGVVLNVGVTNTTASSYLEAYPTGAAPGVATSNQNWVAGETLSSQVISALGKTGQVTFKNYAGTADIVVDVDGYFTNKATTGALFTALAAPKRILTTRTATPLNGGSNSATAITTMTGATATAGVLDVIDLYQGTKAGGNFLTVYPKGTTPPVTANVNYTPSDTYNVVPNAAYGTAGATGDMSVYNGPLGAGKANVVIDEFGYFTPVTQVTPVTPPSPASTYHTTVVATPTSIPANGTTTSTVHATVTGVDNAPVKTDEVMFTDSCGAGIKPVYVDTLATGIATTTFTSTTTPGSCTVTAVEANQHTSGTATITQTPVGYATSVTASPAVLTAGTSDTSTITATVTNAGVAQASDPVTFKVTAKNGATTTLTGCGTVTATAPVLTNASGVATTKYVVGTTPSAFCTITATESNGKSSGTVTVVQKSATSTASKITVSMSPKSVPAGTPSVATVSVTGASGSPITGDEVMLSASTSSVCTVPSAKRFQPTGSVGRVTATVTTAGPGTCTITATEANAGLSGSAVLTVTPTVYSVSVTASPDAITANGTSTSTVTATVKNQTGAVQAGQVVTFGVSLTDGNRVGTVAPVSVITGANGEASVTYTSSKTPGFITIAATDSTAPTGTAPGITQIDQTSV
jgi:hypothetical protein